MEWHKFEDLRSWQKSREIIKMVYQMTSERTFYRDRVLQEQMRRAAISISANIAEGFERNTKKEYIQFLYIAKGSAGELRSHLYVARDLDYLGKEHFEKLHEQLDHLSKMIAKHIAFLKQNQTK